MCVGEAPSPCKAPNFSDWCDGGDAVGILICYTGQSVKRDCCSVAPDLLHIVIDGREMKGERMEDGGMCKLIQQIYMYTWHIHIKMLCVLHANRDCIFPSLSVTPPGTHSHSQSVFHPPSLSRSFHRSLSLTHQAAVLSRSTHGKPPSKPRTHCTTSRP